jgi:hypothetical protein
MWSYFVMFLLPNFEKFIENYTANILLMLVFFRQCIKNMDIWCCADATHFGMVTGWRCCRSLP